MTDDSRTNKIAALLAQLAKLMVDNQPVEIPLPRRAIERTLLTVEEAADRLHIGRTRMFALVKSGDIESVQIGRLRRIHPDAIDAYARRLQNEPKDRSEGP
jgi:excisionase family DNA binding protein